MRKGFAGLLGLVATAGGLLTSHAVTGALPDKYAATLIALGTIIQAFTHPVTAVAAPKE